MNYLPKTLLLYSTVISSFLFVVGLVTTRSDSSLFTHLLLLPVVLLLLYKTSKIRAYEIDSKGFVFIVPALGLVLLSFVSVTNIRQSTQNTQVKRMNETTQNITIVAPSIDLPNYVYIKLDSPDEFVNLRKEPNVQSESLGQGLTGERFEVLNKIDEWYEINSVYGVAYINQDFVEK